MKHLFRSRMLHQTSLRYCVALLLFIAVAATVMVLSPATAQASSFKTSPLMGTTTNSTAIPNSSHGCNQSVCISVCNNAQCTGSGLFIDHVTATGTSTSRSGCVKGELLIRGSVRETTNPVCWVNPPNSVELLHAFYHLGYNVNSGSKVCVKFVGPGAPKGEPCETVHS